MTAGFGFAGCIGPQVVLGVAAAPGAELPLQFSGQADAVDAQPQLGTIALCEPTGIGLGVLGIDAAHRVAVVFGIGRIAPVAVGVVDLDGLVVAVGCGPEGLVLAQRDLCLAHRETVGEAGGDGLSASAQHGGAGVGDEHKAGAGGAAAGNGQGAAVGGQGSSGDGRSGGHSGRGWGGCGGGWPIHPKPPAVGPRRGRGWGGWRGRGRPLRLAGGEQGFVLGGQLGLLGADALLLGLVVAPEAVALGAQGTVVLGGGGAALQIGLRLFELGLQGLGIGQRGDKQMLPRHQWPTECTVMNRKFRRQKS